MGGIVLAIACGYAGRRRGLLKPEWAGRTMGTTMIFCDAPIACLAIWHLRIEPGVWLVPVAALVVGVATCLAGLGVARWRRMPPADAAVFGLQAGMGNVGYTLGGCLCFVLWGLQGLAVEQMFCLMWPCFAFLFCFPIARHYGEAASGVREDVSPPAYALRTLWKSLTDLRSLPLYMAALGLVLNLAGPAPPPFIKGYLVIDALMLVGILLQFGSVGTTVRAGRIPALWKTALGSGLLKFILSPLLMLAVAAAMGLSGDPLAVCLLLAAMPTALYSVLMANLFGLNRDLANTTFILTHAICLALIGAGAAAWLAGLPAGGPLGK
jgi:hypothetical protein